MLTRLSFNQKKSQNISTQQNITNNYNEKQNNQKNLNRSKRTSRLSNLDSCLLVKPIDNKNYQTNAETKLNLSLTYSTNAAITQFKPKISARNHMKQKIQIVNVPQKKKTNTQQFIQLYGRDIMASNQVNSLVKSDFLKNHQVTPILRARMLDWMVEVMKSYKFGNKTYFSGVEIMDRYFSKCKNSIPITELHITGVASMFVATKMEQIFPLKVKTVYEKIVHKKISKESLVQMQMKLIAALDHKINSWTFFDLAILKLADLYQNQDPSILQKMQDLISFISKIILYDYDIYTKYNMQTLSETVLKIASKICNLHYSVQSQSTKQCKQQVIKCYNNYKHSFKGLNNIFKFTDEKVVNQLEIYCLDQQNTN